MGLLAKSSMSNGPQEEIQISDESKDLYRNLAAIVFRSNETLDTEVPTECPPDILFHVRAASNHLCYVKQKLMEMGYVYE